MGAEVTPTEIKQRIADLLDEAAALLADLDAPQMAPPGERVPMQPIILVDGRPRFRANPLVRYLLDEGPFDLNHLARLHTVTFPPGGETKITREDEAQFAQLIGYSVNGYGELSYALNVGDADRKAAELLAAVPPVRATYKEDAE